MTKARVLHYSYRDASHPPSAAPDTPADTSRTFRYVSHTSGMCGATADNWVTRQEKGGGVLGWLHGRRIWRGLCGLAAVASLVSVAPVAAQSLAQAYQVSGSVQKGMIVMLDSKDSEKVRPLTNKKDNAMHGVVVAANETVLSLGNEANVSQVYVANKGKYDVLVSTQNGTIRSGDLVSISSLDGVGMKADSGQSVILGRALADYDGTRNVSGTAELATSTGRKQVAIGLLYVDIGVSHNPLAGSSGSPIPTFMKKAGESIAGKPVSAMRLYLALGVLIATTFMTGSLLYGGVRTSLVSIGRNPLARSRILKGLLQVLFMSLIIFSFGVFAIYLLLRL